MPLPGTRVIGDRWARHHRPTVIGTFTATCDITRPGTGEGQWNPAEGKTDPPPAEVLDTGLQCSVQPTATSDDPAEVAGTVHTLRTYLVQLPADAPRARVDDEVTVTTVDDNGDPALVGAVLRVVDAPTGSLHWTRDLICEHNAG